VSGLQQQQQLPPQLHQQQLPPQLHQQPENVQDPWVVIGTHSNGVAPTAAPTNRSLDTVDNLARPNQVDTSKFLKSALGSMIPGAVTVLKAYIKNQM
jgi:hypothetical protein